MTPSRKNTLTSKPVQQFRSLSHQYQLRILCFTNLIVLDFLCLSFFVVSKMVAINNARQIFQSYELNDLGGNVTEADQLVHTITSAGAEGDNELLPLLHSAAVLGERDLIAGDQEVSSASKLDEFRIRSRNLRHTWDSQQLRWFFVRLLMIDYGIGTKPDQVPLSQVHLAQQIISHYKLHKTMFGDGEDAQSEAGYLFLAEMPEAVKILDTDNDVLSRMLIGFAKEVLMPTNRKRRYTGFFHKVPVEKWVTKLLIDQNKMIDNLVPKSLSALRIEIRSRLQKAQAVFFEYIRNEEDYQLTRYGRRIQEQWNERARYGELQPLQSEDLAWADPNLIRSRPGGGCEVM